MPGLMLGRIAWIIGRWRDPRTRPALLWQGTFMFSASSLVNLVNYLYHVFMGRMLGPAEYGVLVSLLSTLMLLAIPHFIIQTVSANYASRFQAKNQVPELASFFWGGVIRVFFYALVAVMVLLLLSPLLACFLSIPSVWPLVAMSLTLLPWTVNPVAQGTLQGLQRFTWFGSNLFLSSFLRLVFGMALVWLGWGAAGALAGGALGSSVVGLVALIPLAYLWPLRRAGGSGLDLRELVRYSGGVLLATACFSVLTNVDVIVVKRFFPPLEAGYYSAASTLGKVALWLPGAVAIVMFPKSSFRHATGQDASSIARRSVGVVALLCAPVVLAYLFFPRFFVQVLFGSGYQASGPLVYVLGLAMAVYAVNNVVVLYYLSIRKQAFLWVIVAVAVFQVGALVMIHSNLNQVAWVVVSGGLLLLVLSELVCRGLSGGGRKASSKVVGSVEMPQERLS